MDPLQEYFDGIKEAPIPRRLMAETPPEAMTRRLAVNALWATAALALVLAVSTLPAPTDARAANRAARSLGARVALRSEVER